MYGWRRALVGFALAGCVDGANSPWVDPGGEVVPAGDPVTIPGTAVAVRYWAEIHPLSGAIDLYEIHPGNVIYRDRNLEALNYNFGGTATQGTCTPSGNCLPAASAVKLF